MLERPAVMIVIINESVLLLSLSRFLSWLHLKSQLITRISFRLDTMAHVQASPHPRTSAKAFRGSYVQTSHWS